MSSGAYIMAIPLLPIALANELTDGVNAQLDSLKNEENRLDRVYQDTVVELNSIRNAIAKAKESVTNFEYKAVTESFNGIKAVELTRAELADFSETELLFAEVDAETNEVFYVALDFSDAISIVNAVNSTEYKKMIYASNLVKCAMQLCQNDEKEKNEIIEFTNLINKMLDDESVPYDYFCKFLGDRYDYLASRYNNTDIDNDKWDTYCALCAMNGKKARKLSNNEIDEAIRMELQEAYEKKYYNVAKEVLMDVFKELGLSIHEDFELDEIKGVLLEDEENPDYRLFASQDEDSYVLEMVESENSNRTEENRASLCQKRKMVVELARARGIELTLNIENDGPTTGTAKAIKSERSRGSQIEQLRKRRTIQGANGKARMIGG